MNLHHKVIAEGNFNALKVAKKYIDYLKPSTRAKIKAKLIEVLVNGLESINEQVTRKI
jgi:hypothetical protein